MPTPRRRDLLKLGAALATGEILAPIETALALPARGGTGTIQDVEHVVILMQENRSFDHYFGCLRGVRGFGDPRPLQVPGGGAVFNQPVTSGDPVGRRITPFRLDGAKTKAESMIGLDHSWRGDLEDWKHFDVWVPKKTALTMGYFTREDIPFYYALADAFTICDAYFSSLQGPTDPNRMFLFTGTSGLAVGYTGRQTIDNAGDGNWTADASKDDLKFPGMAWTTYAERLQAAGVSWKVYQEYDNFGDNSLAYFRNFRQLNPQSALYERGRSIVPGSTRANSQVSNAEFLVKAFAADVLADRLPQVSWIVAPYKSCEHPAASPSAGEWLVSRLLAALTARPDVWAKTVFLINYDENDG